MGSRRLHELPRIRPPISPRAWSAWDSSGQPCGAVCGSGAPSAVAGLLIGARFVRWRCRLLYQASTSLLLTVGPEATPGTAILDDQAIAQSRAVAELALHKLGLQQSVAAASSGRTRPPLVTDRVLAHHGQCAVEQRRGEPGEVPWPRRSSSSGRDQLEAQQKLVFTGARPADHQAKQQVESITQADQPGVRAARVTRAAGQAQHPAGRAQPGDRARLTSARANRQQLTRRAPRRPPSSQVKGSQVLDAAAPLRRTPG